MTMVIFIYTRLVETSHPIKKNRSCHFKQPETRRPSKKQQLLHQADGAVYDLLARRPSKKQQLLHHKDTTIF